MRAPVRMSNAKSRQLRIDRIVLFVVLVICAKLTVTTQEVLAEDNFSIEKPTGDLTEANLQDTQASSNDRSSFTIPQQPESTIKGVYNEENRTTFKNAPGNTLSKEVSRSSSTTEKRYENIRRIKVNRDNPEYNVEEIDSFDKLRDTPVFKNPRNPARNGKRRYQHIWRSNGFVILSDASSSEEKASSKRKTRIRPEDEHTTSSEPSSAYIDRNEEVNYSRDKNNLGEQLLTKHHELITEEYEETITVNNKTRKPYQPITRNGPKLDKDFTYEKISSGTATAPHADLTDAFKIQMRKDSNPIGKVKIVKRKKLTNKIINRSDTEDKQIHRKNVDIEMPAKVNHTQDARRLVKIKRIRRPLATVKVNDATENKKHIRIRGQTKHTTTTSQSPILQSRRRPRSANLARSKRTIDMSEDGMLMKILRLVQQFLRDPKPNESILRNTKTAAFRGSSRLDEPKNDNRSGRKMAQSSTLVAQESSPVKLQEYGLKKARNQDKNTTKSQKLDNKNKSIANEATTHTLDNKEDQIVKLLSDLQNLETSKKQITESKITTERNEKSTHKTSLIEDNFRSSGTTSKSDNKKENYKPVINVNPIAEHKVSNISVSSSKIIGQSRMPKLIQPKRVESEKPKAEDKNLSNLSEIELLLSSLTSTEEAASTTLDTTTTEISTTTINNADDILNTLLSSLSKETHQTTNAKKGNVTENINNDQLIIAKKKVNTHLSNTTNSRTTTNIPTTTEDTAAYLKKILLSISDVTEESLQSPIEEHSTKNVEDTIQETSQQPFLLEGHTNAEIPTTISPNAGTIVSRILLLKPDQAETELPVNEKNIGNLTTDKTPGNEGESDELEKAIERLLSSIANNSDKNTTSNANKSTVGIGKKAKALHVENVTKASLNLETAMNEISTTTVSTTSIDLKNNMNKLAHMPKNNTLEESLSDLLSSLIDSSITTSNADAKILSKNITHSRTEEVIHKVSSTTLSNNQTVTEEPISEIERLLLNLVSNITDNKQNSTNQDSPQVKKVTTFKPPLELLFGKETVILLDPLKYFEYAEKEKPHQWKEIEIATEANVPAGPGPKKVLTLTLRKRPRGKVSSKKPSNTSKESSQRHSSREQSRRHQVDRHRGSSRWSAANKKKAPNYINHKKTFCIPT